MIYEFFRWFGVITGYPFQFVFFKRKTYYEDKRDFKKHKRGGALIISNHYSVVDYIVNLFFLFPRKLNIVAAELAFQNKFVRFGMRFFGGIQANRVSKSMRFLDESVSLIKKGKLVQIFPEGHNTPDGQIKEFRPTYVMIAARADSVIIPIITDGNYGFFKRTHLYVGKAIHLSDYGIHEHSTKEEILAANIKIHDAAVEMRQKLDSLSHKNKKKRGG